jgi:hypothetical protein
LVCSPGPGINPLASQFWETPLKSGTGAIALTRHKKRDSEGYSETAGRTPGILLNLPLMGTFTRNARQSVFFHELLHHAGPQMDHPPSSGQFDFVTTAQSCCFGARPTEDPNIHPRLSMTEENRDRFPEPENAACLRLMRQYEPQ